MNIQDWFPLGWTGLTSLQPKGTLKSLLQHHSSKASIIRCSVFFKVQLSHPYMTTGKTIALARRTFVDKVMSLLFNMLSRLIITFLPRSKHLLISWLQSPSAVILEPRKRKSATVSPSICHEVMGPEFIYLFIWLYQVLVAAWGIFDLGCDMQDLFSCGMLGSSSLTKNQTQAPCILSTES